MSVSNHSAPAKRAAGATTRFISRRFRPSKVALVIVLAVVGALMLFPALWVITTAFSPPKGFASGALLPTRLSLYNLRHLLATSGPQAPIVRWLINSIFVSTTASIVVAIIDSLAAFALARLTFHGSKAIFLLVVSSLVIPFIAVLLPLYLEFEKLGLLNTYGALILPYTANAFGIFLLYQFFRGIPTEVQEAAVADGASRFRIWRSIFLPLSMPVTITLGLITFMGVYNDFFWPLVSTSSSNMRTITIGIEIVAVGQYSTNFTALMALTVLSVIPMIIVFIFAQRRLVEGISFTGFVG